jgi:hypothetical protein
MFILCSAWWPCVSNFLVSEQFVYHAAVRILRKAFDSQFGVLKRAALCLQRLSALTCLPSVRLTI